MADNLMELRYVMEPLVRKDEDAVGGERYSHEYFFWLEFLNYDRNLKNEFITRTRDSENGFIDWNFLLEESERVADTFSIDQYKIVLQQVLHRIVNKGTSSLTNFCPNYLKNLEKQAGHVISDQVKGIHAHARENTGRIADYRLRHRKDLCDLWKKVRHEIRKKNRIVHPLFKYGLAVAFIGFCSYKLIKYYNRSPELVPTQHNGAMLSYVKAEIFPADKMLSVDEKIVKYSHVLPELIKATNSDVLSKVADAPSVSSKMNEAILNSNVLSDVVNDTPILPKPMKALPDFCILSRLDASSVSSKINETPPKSDILPDVVNAASILPKMMETPPKSDILPDVVNAASILPKMMETPPKSDILPDVVNAASILPKMMETPPKSDILSEAVDATSETLKTGWTSHFYHGFSKVKYVSSILYNSVPSLYGKSDDDSGIQTENADVKSENSGWTAYVYHGFFKLKNVPGLVYNSATSLYRNNDGDISPEKKDSAATESTVETNGWNSYLYSGFFRLKNVPGSVYNGVLSYGKNEKNSDLQSAEVDTTKGWTSYLYSGIFKVSRVVYDSASSLYKNNENTKNSSNLMTEKKDVSTTETNGWSTYLYTGFSQIKNVPGSVYKGVFSYANNEKNLNQPSTAADKSDGWTSYVYRGFSSATSWYRKSEEGSEKK